MKNNVGDYPFLKAIENNSVDNVKSLIKYSKTHGIILNINEKKQIWKFSIVKGN